MYRKILLPLFFLLEGCLISCFSQAQYNLQWFTTYNHPIPFSYSDHASDLVEDNAGNIYVTGTSFGTGDDWRYDFATIKYNSNGAELWVKRYNYFNEEHSNSIKLDNSNNIYVAGKSQDSGFGNSIALIKYDSDGNELWVKRFSINENYDLGFSEMIIDKNDNILIAATSSGQINQFGLIIKCDSSGELKWLSHFSRPDVKYIVFNSLCSDSSENVYVIGFTIDSVYSKTDYLTVKYNSNGILQWDVITDLTYTDIGNSIVLDVDNNIYISGYSSSSENIYDLKIIKYNTSGNIQYIKSLPGLFSSVIPFGYPPKMLIIDRNNNLIVNYMNHRNGYYNDIAVAKYSFNGDLKWQTRYSYSNTSFEFTRDMTVDSSGNIYVTGFSQFDSSYNNFVILKYDSNSILQNIIRNENQFNYNFYPEAMISNNSGSIILTGGGNLNDDFSDFFTVKYSIPIGISNIFSEIPGNYKLYQNYPNPFNPKTIITYEIPSNSLVTLKVYDISGKVISTLVNENQNAGKYEADFDGSNLASGVYYYKITADNFTQTKRMILLK